MSEPAVPEPVLDLLRESGPSTWAYLDVSTDVSDPRGYATSLGTSTADALVQAGAPPADIEALTDVLVSPPGAPAPVSRYVLVRDGRIVLDEVLLGSPRAAASLGHGPVPDLLPLFAHRPVDLAYLVVEVGRDGGGFRVYRYGQGDPVSEQQVQGRTDTLHKFQGGGWSHRNMQSHTEEIWRQNVAQLAQAVDETVRRTSAALVVVAGDIRARQLIEPELSEETRSILSVVAVDTRASDASDAALVTQVEAELARIVEQREEHALDLLRTHLGRSDGTAVTRVGEVATALAAAQVDSLLLSPPELRDRTLLALATAPWVATAPEAALGAPVLGSVPAASALARAAVLTDARVVLTSGGSLPDQTGVGALLRWPMGPETPGT